MDQQTDNRDIKRQIWGISGTILFHLLLILILWFAVIKTPIPPWPDAGGGGGGLGIEVNLGNSENGMGDNTANIAFPEFKEQEKDIINPKDVDLKSTTKDNEESVMSDETNKDNTTSLNTNKDNKTNPKEVKPEEPKINKNALFNKSKSDGNTNKPGNQGDPNGNPNSKNYAKGGGAGTGSGTGSGSGIGPGSGSGTGGGTGSGTGTGTGPGKGPGISFNLGNRSSKVLPPPKSKPNVFGTVVVRIWVDKTGTVTKVLAGVGGSTITDENVLKMAEEAAYKGKFNADPNAAELQMGTITYRYVH